MIPRDQLERLIVIVPRFFAEQNLHVSFPSVLVGTFRTFHVLGSFHYIEVSSAHVFLPIIRNTRLLLPSSRRFTTIYAPRRA